MTQNITIRLTDTTTTSQVEIIQEQASLFALLQARDVDFTLNSHIILEYPELLDRFLTSPIDYINTQLSDKYKKKLDELKEIVILTTYGNKLIDNLTLDGYKANLISMPAGPDNTYYFSKPINSQGRFIYYIEAVNESDEKIRPTFIITARDQDQKIVGGVSGTVSVQNGHKFAYIATTVTSHNAPKGLGSQLIQESLDYLKRFGVEKVHLGTQTADRFYISHGFKPINSIIKNIRYRLDANGNKIQHDLIILERTL